MNEPTAANDQVSPSTLQTGRQRRLSMLFWSAALAFVLGGGIFLLIWKWRPTELVPLDGELNVTLLKMTKGKQESYSVDDPNALPIRAGDRMHLEIRYKQPALTYVIWLDSRGKVVPLYPWNMDEIEITDANQPPPVCMPTTLVINPITIGKAWKFEKGSGLETVLLLARRTPLGAEIKLETILGDIPPAKLSDPGEMAILRLDRGENSISTLKAAKRGSMEEARARDEALAARLEKLRDHFELIRVIRFAHEDK